MLGSNLMNALITLSVTFLLSWTWAPGWAFLLEGDIVPCPRPAANCLDDTFNRVLPILGCLGCQSGCITNHTMTANPGYRVTEGDISGNYDYMNITIPKSKNISEPQWLCIEGDKCPWGYYADKMGTTKSCSYCGEGCRSCQSYDACQQCVLGYRLHQTTASSSYCTSSKVRCPSPPAHCEYTTYVSQTVGCLGCIFCNNGYLPAYNPNYRRHGDNITSGSYDYQGLHISGSVEVNEPRYICLQGTTCPSGWHNVTRGDLTTCEVDPSH